MHIHSAEGKIAFRISIIVILFGQLGLIGSSPITYQQKWMLYDWPCIIRIFPSAVTFVCSLCFQEKELRDLGDWRKNIKDKSGMDGRKKMFEDET